MIPTRHLAAVRELQKLTQPIRHITSPGLTALLAATAAHAQKAHSIIHQFRTEAKK